MEKYIKTNELMDYLGVSRTTLYRLRQRGLPSQRIGGTVVFKLSEVDEWIQETDSEEGKVYDRR
jgi:excisionase family DNA binding protein